jgi:hypothetical protein
MPAGREEPATAFEAKGSIDLSAADVRIIEPLLLTSEPCCCCAPALQASARHSAHIGHERSGNSAKGLP